MAGRRGSTPCHGALLTCCGAAAANCALPRRPCLPAQTCAGSIVCNNVCCDASQQGCSATGACVQCDADADCGSNGRCCNGQCITNGYGNFNDPCCGVPSNATACGGSLTCNSTTGPGTCLCPNGAPPLCLAAPCACCSNQFAAAAAHSFAWHLNLLAGCCRANTLRQQLLL